VVDVWTCTVCNHGHPVGEVQPTIAGNFTVGQCDNLNCVTRKDKGNKKRPPRRSTFRREARDA